MNLDELLDLDVGGGVGAALSASCAGVVDSAGLSPVFGCIASSSPMFGGGAARALSHRDLERFMDDMEHVFAGSPPPRSALL
jgi:hypothetical protein